MKWYDYAYMVPIAVIVVIVATPLLWFTSILEIFEGAKEAEKEKRNEMPKV